MAATRCAAAATTNATTTTTTTLLSSRENVSGVFYWRRLAATNTTGFLPPRAKAGDAVSRRGLTAHTGVATPGMPGGSGAWAARAAFVRLLTPKLAQTMRTMASKTARRAATSVIRSEPTSNLVASSSVAVASQSAAAFAVLPHVQTARRLLSSESDRRPLSFSRKVRHLFFSRGLTSYARFAQQLRARYNSKAGDSGSASAAAAGDSGSATKGSTDGRATAASALCNGHQNKDQFTVNGQPVLVSSTSTIPGYTVVSYKGFVQGCAVLARDMLLMAKVFLVVQLGGEVKDMASLIQRTKREAVDRLCKEAAAVGANAVVGVRLVSSGTHQRTAVEFSAYGTAVLVRKTL